MKLRKINQFNREQEEYVNFELEDGTVLHYTITKDSGGTVFLYNPYDSNAQIFMVLGIENPADLYKKLGIYENNGVCPYCKRENLPLLFDYLLDHYGTDDVEYEETPKEPEKKDYGEYDWILG